jgi:hypothetical protein
MKIKEFIKHLKKYPQDFSICFEYGHRDLYIGEIYTEDDKFLVLSLTDPPKESRRRRK